MSESTFFQDLSKELQNSAPIGSDGISDQLIALNEILHRIQTQILELDALIIHREHPVDAPEEPPSLCNVKDNVDRAVETARLVSTGLTQIKGYFV